MFVDRRKILLGSLNSGTTIDIPLKTNFFPVDNAELIEDKFVKDEVNNSINPIIDKIHFVKWSLAGIQIQEAKERMDYSCCLL